MHIADPTIGIFGANGIVGAGLPIAVGAAAAAQLRADGGVAVAFFGDGAVAQGAFHEAVNLAAVWKLPVVFWCENNGYAEFSPAATQHAAPLERRAAGTASATWPSTATTWSPSPATMAARRRRGARAATARRSSRRPPTAGTVTTRATRSATGPTANSTSGRSATRSSSTPDGSSRRRRRRRTRSHRLRSRRSTAMLDDGGRGRHGAAPPDVATLGHFVLRDRPQHPEPAPIAAGRAGLPDDGRDPRRPRRSSWRATTDVFVAGIDVGEGGNVFGLMRGLRDKFGERVRDTPISETAIMGLGVGAAMAGMRPVVEIMYLDFVGVCLDQLLNQAAKMPFMTGGNARMALTVRTQFGAGRSSGSQHSQSLEALLAHIPGLTVVMPSNPADTYGLLRAAIQDPNPVVFIENRLLYGMKGPQPPADHIVPIGKSIVVRPGTDITLVSVSRMVHEALAAAEEVAADGISVEVIDLRTVAPLDLVPVLDSVHKTSRLLIAHEAVLPFGIGAEIAATVAREAFWDLDAPIERIGAAPTPAPYAPGLEQAWLPDRDDIAAALPARAVHGCVAGTMMTMPSEANGCPARPKGITVSKIENYIFTVRGEESDRIQLMTDVDAINFFTDDAR